MPGAAPPRRVALVGANGTGKTTLARQLTQALLPASEWIIEDLTARSLPALTQAHATLLMGLDLPLQQTRPERVVERAEEDRALRQALASSGVQFNVIYGTGEERLAQALVALRAGVEPAKSTSTWVWQCDKCSDSACEHRLLTGLLNRGR